MNSNIGGGFCSTNTKIRKHGFAKLERCFGAINAYVQLLFLQLENEPMK